MTSWQSSWNSNVWDQKLIDYSNLCVFFVKVTLFDTRSKKEITFKSKTFAKRRTTKWWVYKLHDIEQRCRVRHVRRKVMLQNHSNNRVMLSYKCHNEKHFLWMRQVLWQGMTSTATTSDRSVLNQLEWYCGQAGHTYITRRESVWSETLIVARANEAPNNIQKK